MLDLILFHDFADRLALIRQQRAEAAKKREEEKAGNFLDVYIDLLKFSFSVSAARIDILFVLVQPKSRRSWKLVSDDTNQLFLNYTIFPYPKFLISRHITVRFSW